MSHLSSNSVAPDRLMAGGATAAARTRTIGIAWVATLLLSNLPLVIARDVLETDIARMAPIWLVSAALLAGATYLRPALQPLRRYFAIMGVIVLMTHVVQPLVWQTAAWQRFAAVQPEIVAVFGYRVSLLLSPLVVLLALFVMGYSRREAFLTRGRLSAPVEGVGLPGGRRLSWALLGPAVSLLLGGLFFLFLLTQDPAVGSGLGRALRWLPLVLASAALNAFVEEATYRAAPLATLLPAVGSRHAIWLTSVWFGLGHYYGGIPSGPVGLLQSGLLAVLLGKAMVDTRGMGWSWTIHLALDSVIYLALAATS